METRTLGNTGFRIAPLMFGGNVFGWTADEQTSFRLLDAFTDAGFNAVDTADIYTVRVPGNTGGDSERIIGKWLHKTGKRDKVMLATKVGGVFSETKRGLKKAYILQSVDDSLQRLQTDHIDLYQTHYDDEETPIEETLETYGELIKSGKVRAIGTSNMTLPRIIASAAVSKNKHLPAYQTLQPEYNLFEREKFETEYAPYAIEHNLGTIPYFALASGFLTGKYRKEEDIAGSARAKYLAKYMTGRGFRILDALDEVAARYNANPSMIAIAWLKDRPGVTAPIASATSISQLNEIIRAVSLRLDADAMDTLNAASDYNA
ncbi:aldo/keto reductase [Chitinophaga sp. GCM10012297]|uniref:Aldo/keto reductase n=1 Tax=Chitinophaga chungangae TaxID=2821488 RepID=A0ABS3YCC6_9BACT|nr:aldo/keto reductase [Chitinophaga chungangae]MBO9152311.1 aldo/keto reductase [Chitinophaga chungangae]